MILAVFCAAGPAAAIERAVAPVRVTCADRFHSPTYNSSDTLQNNVPLNQCYKNVPGPTSGPCVYNWRKPGRYADGKGWTLPCPSSPAGSNCCGWASPICCYHLDHGLCPGFPLNGSYDLCRQLKCAWNWSEPGCSERPRPTPPR